jgi:FkbM family methyltransferase
MRRAVSVATCDVIRKLLDADRVASYAQIGEDRIIAYYLADCSSRYYVDVGCGHPIRLSNTYSLYQQGWSGLCLDGNAGLIELFRRVRPRDDANCVCVGGHRGQAKFVISSDPALSHLADTAGPLSRRSEGEEHLVEVRTLAELFDAHRVPSRFGLLSIDVEGAEFAVLKSFDLEKHRPVLIVVEIHGLSLTSCAEHAIVADMRTCGYELVGYSVCNAFFLDRRSTS